MQRKTKENKLIYAIYVIIAMLSVLLVITTFQSFQISTLSSEIKNIKITRAVAETSGSTSSETSSETSNIDATSNGGSLQQILKEITPTGTPEYGRKAGVSYDNVEQSLQVLAGYQSLSLSGDEQKRYDVIANTEGTACKYCCGATKLAQNCGCSHNKALDGLTKWLIKNTDYTNEQILEEIHKWQILFFPQPTLLEELQKRGISPESVGLPSMRGGC